MHDQLRDFQAQFVHDVDHRRAPLPAAEAPQPIEDAPMPHPAPEVTDPPPSQAPSSFFILGVSDVLDVLDGLMGLCFFCVSVST